MDESEMIRQAQDYANNHDSFDISFIDSLEESLDQYGELTPGQYEGLKNIYDKFRIGQWFYKEESKDDEE